MNTYKPQEFAEMIGGIHMSHVITMDNVRQLNVFSFSKKDNSPRGYQTVGIEELQGSAESPLL